MDQLVEYFYVDRARVESYYEQLRTRRRKVPQLSLGVSATGPQLGVTFAQESDGLARKVEAVRSELELQGMLAFSRPSDQDRWDLREREIGGPPPVIFRQELIDLRTAQVPPNATNPLFERGLTFWLSGSDVVDREPTQLLVLLQEFPLSDQNSAWAASGSSLLWIAADIMHRRDLLFPLPEVEGIDKNPITALKSMGAKVGPKKRCHVLYRVRGTFAEQARSYALTTLGYPLAIWQEHRGTGR